MGVRTWVAVITALLAGAVPAIARPATQRSPKLSIRIHDYANLRMEDLQRAQSQVTDTYAQTGVDIEWRTVVRPSEVMGGHGEWPRDTEPLLTVIVLAQGMPAPTGMPDNVAGYAPLTRDQGGHIAFVFADRARTIAERAAVEQSRVLSLVIAHEIAHLLMPRRSHSSDGLMRAEWEAHQFARAASQRFRPDEARAIREMVASLQGGTQRVAD